MRAFAETSTAPRLAVVEDDDELRECILVPTLRRAGFEVTALRSALELYRMWVASPFDLVLLDVGLPDDDGVEIARHLRTLAPEVGIVVYTGHGATVDRLRGLRAGVDAYLIKPVETEELVETLRNVQRRSTRAPAPAETPTTVEAGSSGWKLVGNGWKLQAPCGAEITLGATERDLVGELVANACKPVDRSGLIERLTADVEAFDPHRLDMLVYRLRRKCEQASGHPLPLRAVRGVGYMIDW